MKMKLIEVPNQDHINLIKLQQCSSLDNGREEEQ